MTRMQADMALNVFVDFLRRSKLFDADEVRRLAARARSYSAQAFATDLINSGDLTRYQAEKLLRGRWQGLVIGPYTVLAPLGRGGMGTVVYLARDRRVTALQGEPGFVALKILPNRKAISEPRILARFRREMDLGQRVDHPNVVRTLEAGDLDEVHYLALEYVPGWTLRQLVTQRGSLPVGEAAWIFADVAAGLAHLHERGIVHRDVKPSNVMVRPDGDAVILDLGLALMPGEPLPEDPAIAGGRGYVVGTMDYLAPEQATNAVDVGPGADLYSLGCTLFFALTGAPPFPAEDTKQKIRRHRADPPPSLPHVPSKFASLVAQLMAKSSEKRPGSASEVRELLQPWVTGSHVGGAVDPLAVADAPGKDVELWEATPGEELPHSNSQADSNPFASLDDASGTEVERARNPALRWDLVGWFFLAVLVVILCGLVFLAITGRL